MFETVSQTGSRLSDSNITGRVEFNPRDGHADRSRIPENSREWRNARILANSATPDRKRCLAVVFIIAYLGATAAFGFLHAMGESAPHPVAYFWTWDMFPGYSTHAHRRIAVGRTESGRYVQLFPGPAQRFGWGVDRELNRIDVLPNVTSGAWRTFFHIAVEKSLESAAADHRDDPIVQLTLLEAYWPMKFNLADDLYEAVYEQPNPRRRYWRIIEEANVATDGTILWSDER